MNELNSIYIFCYSLVQADHYESSLQRIFRPIASSNRNNLEGENTAGESAQVARVILYSGRYDNQHMQGMAIMMNQEATKALIDWSPINERIIKARFYSKFVKVTMIHMYAPTNESDIDEQTKEDFYGKLQEVTEQVHNHDMLIITGDMNEKVGNLVNGLGRVMG